MARFEALLTSSQLAELCWQLGVPLPTGVRRPRARRPTDPPVDEPPVALLAGLSVLADPACLVTLYRHDRSGLDMINIAADHQLAVIHGPLPSGLHRLAGINRSEVLAAVRSLVALEDRPLIGPGEMRPSAADLQIATARAQEGDSAGATSALRASGAPRDLADAFVAALIRPVAVGSATIVHRVAPARVAGATVGWLDGGAAGLWRIDPPDLGVAGDPGGLGPADLYRIRAPVAPTTPNALMEELATGSPPWM
jgi:hypothetical protein